MSAAELRKAAETLRERAEAATPGPWESELCEEELSVRAGSALTSWRVGPDGYRIGYPPSSYAATDVLVEYELEEWGENPDNTTETQRVADADYIATMHPGVGLALADWLDATAERAETRTGTRRGGKGRYLWDATRIARLINGGTS